VGTGGVGILYNEVLMRNFYVFFLVLVTFPALSYVAYTYHFKFNFSSLYLTTTAILFLLVFGIHLWRQTVRYRHIRDKVAKFDGLMLGLYRTAGQVSEAVQGVFGEIIAEHYEHIMNTKKWHIHFTRHSATLADLSLELRAQVVDRKVDKLAAQALGTIVSGLVEAEVVRKEIGAHYKERISVEHWLLIGVFTGAFLAVVFVIASKAVLYMALLKGAMATAALLAVFYLFRLSLLITFEKRLGEASGREILFVIAEDQKDEAEDVEDEEEEIESGAQNDTEKKKK
jgi:hypothetical protein